MRILHVNKFLYRRGGAEAYMLELAAMQRSLGHDVELFGMSHPDNLPAKYAEHFPDHVEFEPPPEGVSSKLVLAARMLWSRQSRDGMARVLERFAPDVVHLHNIYHQLSPAVLQPIRKRGIPAAMTLHDYKLACPTYQLMDTNPANGSHRLCRACVDGSLTEAAKRACKGGSRAASALAALEVGLHRRMGAYDPVGAFICPSAFLAGIMAQAGVYPERMHILDNFTTIPEQPRSGPGEHLLFFGRLSREKGVDTLIDAYRLLRQRISTQVPQLHIAGDGPEAAELRHRAAGLEDSVVFHGRVDTVELADLLRQSRASIVPSRWYENQPLSVLESMAFGVPVVATNLGGLPDLIDPGVTGLLVPADSPVQLAAALERCALHPELCETLGRAARHAAELRFSPAGHTESVLSIYDKLQMTDLNDQKVS